MKTSLTEIRSFNPCASGLRNVQKLGKEEFFVYEALDTNSIDDVLWLLWKKRVAIMKIVVPFARWCADRAASAYATYAAADAAHAAANAAYVASASAHAAYASAYAAYTSASANAANANAAAAAANAANAANAAVAADADADADADAERQAQKDWLRAALIAFSEKVEQ